MSNAAYVTKSKIGIVIGDCFQVLADKQYRNKVDLIIADPPYGDITKEKWDVACYDRLGELIRDVLKPGGTAFVWGGIGKPAKNGKPHHRPFFKWLAHLEDRIPELCLYDVITWSKKRAYGLPDRLLFTREEIAMIVKGEKPKTFNVPLLEKERGYAGYDERYPAKSKFLRRTNVWSDITEIFKGKIHECEKPKKLAEVMIHTSSNPGDFIVDPFAGSLSTGLAMRDVGNRHLLLIEKDDTCNMHDIGADTIERH